MSVISLMNQKGGVAKTTTAVNLAAALSLLNKKVLVIDCDEQCNLSHTFSVYDVNKSVANLFRKKKFDIVNVRKNIDIIPASYDFIDMASEIMNSMARESILKKGIKEIKDDYDIILIDCPPSINDITKNALTASDYVVIPVKTDSYSESGVEVMIEVITQVKEALNEDLELLGILPTLYEKQLKIAKKTLRNYEKKEWSQALLKPIRKNTDIENATAENKTIFEYNKDSNGAEDYRGLANQIISILN